MRVIVLKSQVQLEAAIRRQRLVRLGSHLPHHGQSHHRFAAIDMQHDSLILAGHGLLSRCNDSSTSSCGGSPS